MGIFDGSLVANPIVILYEQAQELIIFPSIDGIYGYVKIQLFGALC